MRVWELSCAQAGGAGGAAAPRGEGQGRAGRLGAAGNGGNGEEKAATAGGTELKGQEGRICKKGKGQEVEGQRWRNVL